MTKFITLTQHDDRKITVADDNIANFFEVDDSTRESLLAPTANSQLIFKTGGSVLLKETVTEINTLLVA